MAFLIDQGGGGPVSPSVRKATAMNFVIDVGQTTIKFKNYNTGATLATFPTNVLSAVASGAGIAIEYIGGETQLIKELNNSTIKIADTPLTGDVATNVSALNIVFANAGGGVAPVITNINPTIQMAVGATLNLQVTATNAVTFSWDNISDTSFVTVEGDHSKLIGGASVLAGTYTAVARVTNYHGYDTKTFSIVVSAAFTNTLSFSGTGDAWMRNVNGATYDTTAFYRLSQGSGITEAWSCSFWLKTAFTGTAS